jgi:uncharacterized SAM-binding protein YcdF (DUF218 family)
VVNPLRSDALDIVSLEFNLPPFEFGIIGDAHVNRMNQMASCRLSPRNAFLALSLAIILAASAWVGVPHWLSIEDSLEHCAAILVLNGDPPARADEAARLYHAGFGAEVWLTDDPDSSDAAGDAGSRWNAVHLVELGVPVAVLRHVPGIARGTRAEMEAVGTELRRRQVPCAIAVTSPLHARRVKLTWDRHVGAPRLIVRHAPGANYVGWAKTAREFVGSLLVIAGLD